MFQKQSFSTFLVLFTSLLPNVSAVKYTSGSTQVDVTTTMIDKNNSTEKCVTFLTDAPEKYSTACFTTIYTDGGTFYGCKVKLGDNECSRCSACENNDEEVGFEIDCDSIEPAESTYTSNPACIVLNDANIQEVLVDTVFADTPFDFSMSSVVTDDSDMANDTSTKDKSTSGTSPQSNGFYNSFLCLSTGAVAVSIFTSISL